MALSVKHLNSDASFLLSFEPVYSDPSTGSVVIPQPFTILLDPWITGPSKIVHSRFSITTHKIPPCVTSLAQLPEPDLVIISQHKSDHCNEATLRQLPASGTKTIILAEPASARLIKSWKYFDRNKIRTIEPWKDPRVSGKSNVLRIPVPPVMPGGQKGEVTVSWIPQKRDIAGLHGAIGITYRAPYTQSIPKMVIMPPLSDELTPPATPVSPSRPSSIMQSPSITGVHLVPPSPPMSPRSLRSVRSTATFSPSHSLQLGSPLGTQSRCRCSLRRSLTTSSFTQQGTRPISLLFSPHGISYNHVGPWATSHLVSEAALPLTALLHCMDSISNPWWLGGNICSGTLTGAEIANNLGARVWISAHDAEKNVKGFATGLLRTRRWETEEIVEIVSPKFKGNIGGDDYTQKGQSRRGSPGLGLGDKGTEVLRLQSGEDVLVTGEGMVFAAGFS